MTEPFDVAVVGGGVNGCGIARDCARRGLRTLLLEKDDFGAGASGGSSGMIHGGLRYLLADVATTRKSCLDSGYIQKICPHLVWRIPLLMPLTGAGVGARFHSHLVETFLEAYERFAVPLKNGRPHCRLDASAAHALEPMLAPDVTGALTFDEWGIDAARLCLLNALSAREHGAEVRNHTAVTALRREGSVWRLTARAADAGAAESFAARVVVNAGGPWLPRIAGWAGATVRIRPGKGVHLLLERRIANVGVVATAVDGRQIFLLPHDNYSLIGTTDDDTYGDPDALTVTEDEVEYLLEGIEHTLPGIRRHRIATTWAAIRPTLHAWGPSEDSLSRDHRIIDHGAAGVPGLLSVAGGKLAAYRLMSEEAADAVEQALGRAVTPSRTAHEPLPGGDRATPDALLVRGRERFDRVTLLRLHARYGSRADEILDRIDQDPAQGRVLCAGEPVLAAEVHYAVDRELARTPLDVLRRTRLGAGACQGLDCLDAAVAILQRRLGWDRETAAVHAAEFRADRWRRRRPVLAGAGLAHEEILRARLARGLP